MSLAMIVDPVRRRLYVRGKGRITFEEILAHLESERASGILSFSELVDATDAEPGFTPEQVRELVQRLRRLALVSPLGRTAIVVGSDLAFGMLRMLQMMIDDVVDVCPFRSSSEARTWLDEDGAA